MGQRITTDGHIGFLANLSDTTVHFAMDNGIPWTLIDSAFFFSHFDTNMFQLRDFFPPINRYRYEGEIDIKIRDSVYKINHFVVRPFRAMGADSFQVIIGYDILQHHVLNLDFVNKQFALIDDYLDSGYVILPLESIQEQLNTGGIMEYKYFYANVCCGSKVQSGKFWFDLGCGGDVAGIFKERFFRDLEKDAVLLDSGMSKGSNFFSTKSYHWCIDSVTFPGFCSTNIKIGTILNHDNAFYDNGQNDGTIGWQFFKGCEIIVDWKKNVLLVKQITNGEE
ncbi:hypothetical protein FACS1894178_1110 [Bacteroidia bacterium]|nr:hypothetical protein FACS1894178_1110 [Bacteroidia bacterium]